MKNLQFINDDSDSSVKKLIKKLPLMISDTSYVYTCRMQENILYLLCIGIGVHCACSRTSIRQIGGGMHLLIDG